jgi:flagellar hook-associated protein 3 FlgL
MISSLDPTSELFLANIGRVQDRLATASRQVSSGTRVATPSDAPDQIGTLLQLRAAQSHNTQVQANLSLAQTMAQAADNALSSSTQLMDRALVLADEAASSTVTAASRQSIAQEVQALQEEMVANSRTMVQGHYIFSGDAYDTPAYSSDLNAPNGVDQLSTAAATGQIEDPAGGTFPSSKTAQEIFDTRNADGTAATDNVFNALNTLRLALLNNDTDGVTNSINLIQASSDHLNSEQAFYGSVENRIQNAVSFGQGYDVQLQTEVSQIADADIPSAAMELTQTTTELQAAFQMEAKMPHSSLFDYLG